MDIVNIHMTATPTIEVRSTFDGYLKSRGIKQSWLAGETGINKADISRIAAGMRPGRARAHAIAKALSVTCAALGWPEHDLQAVA